MYMQEVRKMDQEVLDILNRPLPKEALKDHPTKKDSSGNPMTTIKAIFVIDRLNEAFGVGEWKLKTDYLTHEVVDRVTQANKNRREYVSAVKTIFTVDKYDIHLECIAGSTNDDLGDALKGGTTDGITKIASYLGIGADIWRAAKNKTQESSKPAPQKPAAQTPTTQKADKQTTTQSAPRGGMTPNMAFDDLPTTKNQPKETEIEKKMKELQPLLDEIKTFEDISEFNKKHFTPCNDETLKALIKAKMKAAFDKLPESEKAKNKAKAK